ncbi:hypothetical protein TthHB5008_08780 [Thermus thermophilus]|nr:hypothetical protein TthHB5008_08780 [Thermus thermophilus]
MGPLPRGLEETMITVAQAVQARQTQEDGVVLVLSALEAKTLMNVLRGEAEWGELPEALEEVYRTLRAWERRGRTA